MAGAERATVQVVFRATLKCHGASELAGSQSDERRERKAETATRNCLCRF